MYCNGQALEMHHLIFKGGPTEDIQHGTKTIISPDRHENMS